MGPKGNYYEKARGTRTGAARVGPNQFLLRGASRNDRDGSIRQEDGKGTSLAQPDSVLETSMTREATPWLDLANIRFGIDRPAARPELLYDVIEVRVFDHATGKTLQNWELITPDTVQIRSVGTPLPDAVDLWFRMASHASETDRFELALSPGASLDLPGGTLTVREVHSGQPSYATKPGARKSSGTTVVLDWLGSAGSGNYQIGLADLQDRVCFSHAPHFPNLGAVPNPTSSVLHYDLPLELASHLVVRPYAERGTFFFDGVRLPKNSAAALSPPPPARIEINGKAGHYATSAWDPIRLSLQALEGRPKKEGISRSTSTIPGLTGLSVWYGELEDPAEHSTWIVEVDGLRADGLALGFFDREGNALPEGRSGSRLRSMPSSPQGMLVFETVPVSLSEISTVEVRLQTEAKQ